ncbi:hypothetical protein [Microcoleus vaginatus]|nr:hypothetical protein MicvaDRAFT_1146 [Microcoleus vaginatus FGP-2]
MKEEGRRKREEGRGKREEGRGKREEVKKNLEYPNLPALTV